MPYVARMESTPVMGVEIKKDSVAPLLAPLFLMLVASGITPHEQTGRGMPKRVDFITEKIFSFPKCLVTRVWGTSSCKIPAKINPKSIYGAIALLNSIRECANLRIISIFVTFMVEYITIKLYNDIVI